MIKDILKTIVSIGFGLAAARFIDRFLVAYQREKLSDKIENGKSVYIYMTCTKVVYLFDIYSL